MDNKDQNVHNDAGMDSGGNKSVSIMTVSIMKNCALVSEAFDNLQAEKTQILQLANNQQKTISQQNAKLKEKQEFCDTFDKMAEKYRADIDKLETSLKISNDAGDVLKAYHKREIKKLKAEFKKKK